MEANESKLIPVKVCLKPVWFWKERKEGRSSQSSVFQKTAAPAVDPVFFYLLQLSIAAVENGVYSPELCISSYEGYSCARWQSLTKIVFSIVTIVIYMLGKVLRRAEAMLSMHGSR